MRRQLHNRTDLVRSPWYAAPLISPLLAELHPYPPPLAVSRSVCHHCTRAHGLRRIIERVSHPQAVRSAAPCAIPSATILTRPPPCLEPFTLCLLGLALPSRAHSFDASISPCNSPHSAHLPFTAPPLPHLHLKCPLPSICTDYPPCLHPLHLREQQEIASNVGHGREDWAFPGVHSRRVGLHTVRSTNPTNYPFYQLTQTLKTRHCWAPGCPGRELG